MGVLFLFSGDMYSCHYPSLCHDLESYLAASMLFFYIDPLLLAVTSIWFIRTIKKMEKYPKENICIAISWLIAIGTFVHFIGYSG